MEDFKALLVIIGYFGALAGAVWVLGFFFRMVSG